MLATSCGSDSMLMEGRQYGLYLMEDQHFHIAFRALLSEFPISDTIYHMSGEHDVESLPCERLSEFQVPRIQVDSRTMHILEPSWKAAFEIYLKVARVYRGVPNTCIPCLCHSLHISDDYSPSTQLLFKEIERMMECSYIHIDLKHSHTCCQGYL
jgi:hypothetical protein